ncbi:hypothetical protein TOPH_03299 [Tolypocladium ophioglossoides CBS 100239]|uniref:Uncharacterized protein n=1 Tax=Tolypocladium ophioglossoides (strain CBS 100239) TaxID=1163406 RepID=A0A0L0NDF4_TOLOC|nr:hypothetical protein TOPH_03299 [Tolypocladium ophioglossoides CBS 100239]
MAVYFSANSNYLKGASEGPLRPFLEPSARKVVYCVAKGDEISDTDHGRRRNHPGACRQRPHRLREAGCREPRARRPRSPGSPALLYRSRAARHGGEAAEAQARRAMRPLRAHLHHELPRPQQHRRRAPQGPAGRPQARQHAVCDVPEHPVRRLHPDAGALQHVHQPHPAAVALYRLRHAALGPRLNPVRRGQQLCRHGDDPLLPRLHRAGLPPGCPAHPVQVVHPAGVDGAKRHPLLRQPDFQRLLCAGWRWRALQHAGRAGLSRVAVALLDRGRHHNGRCPLGRLYPPGSAAQRPWLHRGREARRAAAHV